MLAKITIPIDELRIITNSINWIFNGPYSDTFRPRLRERESEALKRLSEDLPRQFPIDLAVEFVTIEIGEPYSHEPGRIRLSHDEFCWMSMAVGSFYGENWTSPTEIEVVTNLPAAKTKELLLRLREVRVLTSDESRDIWPDEWEWYKDAEGAWRAR